MATLTEKQRAFVRDNPFYAVLTTLRRDGSPHSTVIWVDEDDGDLIFNTARGRAKERHMASDGRASIAIVDPHDPYRWLAVSGAVELSAEGGDAGIDALSRRYTGADYAWRRPGEVRINARLTPDRVDSSGLDS